MSPTPFDDLKHEMSRGGPDAALSRLVDKVKAQRQYHDLFDALLMRARLRLGLSVAKATSLDDLSPELRDKMEQAYLEICREVGGLLLDAGKVREAWMYLRPVGEPAEVAKRLVTLEPTDENIEEIIEISMHEGVAPAHGFQLVLKRYGTCNAITMFEQSMRNKPQKDQREVAGILVRHLHRDLLESLRSHIERHEGRFPDERSIRELVADRDWLFADGSYHIDTSHLSSVTRIALLCDDAATQRLALDMTEYGRRLDPQFQYAGDEPFTDLYPSHARFLQALLGEQVDEAIQYFRGRAEAVALDEQGPAAAETYISLLARLGRYGEAIDETTRLLPPGAPSLGLAPTLLDLASSGNEFKRLLRVSEERNDLLSYAAALVQDAGPS